MDKSLFAILTTVGLCITSVVGDYLLKRASNQECPLASAWFVSGFVVYSSTAFGWVYVMRHLKFATTGVVYAIGTIVLMALVGALFLKESLQWQEVAGVGFALLSICLLTRFA
ncbi:MAG: transporter [Acidobacteria bacterium]|nr:transporter [Acidobacteriota bacterium]